MKRKGASNKQHAGASVRNKLGRDAAAVTVAPQGHRSHRGAFAASAAAFALVALLLTCLQRRQPHPSTCNWSDQSEGAALLLRGAAAEGLELRALERLLEKVVLLPAADGAGREVMHLQGASEDVLAPLWKFAATADACMPAWNIAKRLNQTGRPSLRRLDGLSHVVGDAASEWRHEGATLYAVAVVLSSSQKDFEGGELEVYDGNASKKISDLRRGDVIVWRGWDRYRVQPVTRGRLTMVLAQWWLGPSGSPDEPHPEDTEDLTSQALSIDATSGVLNEMLADFMTKRQDPRAHKIWRAVLQKHPLNTRAHFNLGTLMQNRGDLKEAAVSFAAAIKIAPDYADAHANLGMVLAQLGDIEGAEQSLLKAVAIAPTADGYHDLGIVVGSKGDIAGAENIFQAALSLDTEHAGANFNLGRLRASQGNHTGAAESFRAATRASPGDAEAHFGLGTAALALGHLEEAERSFRATLRADPSHGEASAQLDGVLKIRGGATET
eukprot:TRINITY_DN62122_c0_g1_i1.p1 TRINITY_DN62122_c0_g1~~TRINITY_DN62122_c0_g1_i1.p1  ORF type:complete len:497 (-),score=104.78 TRINITY_DN62122_c0_g1_i1:102-1592(-)